MLALLLPQRQVRLLGAIPTLSWMVLAQSVEGVQVTGSVVREAAVPEYVKTDEDLEKCPVVIIADHHGPFPPVLFFVERYTHIVKLNITQLTLRRFAVRFARSAASSRDT
jgi:hypothetical protein